MDRRAGTVPLVMLAVLMLHPPSAFPPGSNRTDVPPAPVLPASEPVPPSVRVEHELVRLPKPVPQVSRPRAWRTTRLASAVPDEPRTPLIVRARRAFVGDGRYKPEPFPRLDR